MSKTLRAAVVGVGHLGRWHAEKYTRIENVELVAVCDLNQTSREELAQKYRCLAMVDYRDLKDRVDLVTIATPTNRHFEVAKFFLENNVPVHVEKPITLNSSEARILVKLAEEKNLTLQVGHVERFNPALIMAREKLGTPLFIECHRLAPFKPRSVDVDVVMDLMIHDLDLILNLVESQPISVLAVGSPVLTQKIDIANARIEFANKTVANVTASRVSLGTQRKFRVFQPDQYLSIDFGAGEVALIEKAKAGRGSQIMPSTEPSTTFDLPLERHVWQLEKGDALLDETRAFVDAVRAKSPALITGQDGLKALELAETIVNTINVNANLSQ